MTNKWKQYGTGQLGALLAFMVAATPTHAGAAVKKLVGVIQSVEKGETTTVHVGAKGAETRAVRADANTIYRKWFDDKRYRDSSSDASKLVEGKCVEVEMRTDDPTTAKQIRISEYGAGSLYDQCRGRR
jgi:hypothetical protein